MRLFSTKSLEWLIITLIHIVSWLYPQSTPINVSLGVLIIYSAYRLFVNDYNSFFALLLVGAYHSGGSSVYTLDIFSISAVYFLFTLFIIKRLNDILRIKNLYFIILIPFLIAFIIDVFLGLFNKLSWYSLFIETFSFTFFYLSLIIGLKGIIYDQLLKSLKIYLLYIVPLITIINVITIIFTGNDVLYRNEFSMFFTVAYIPFIYFNKDIDSKKYLVIFIFIIFLKAIFLSLGSFEIIALFISLLLFFISQFKIRYIIIALITFLIISNISITLINKYGNNFTKFKVAQIIKTAEVFKGGINSEELIQLPFSARVRLLEYYNVSAELHKMSVFNIIFGKGYGSYFTMTNYKPENYGIKQLKGRGAYPDDEIDMNKYQRPHNSFFFLLLKSGYIGILFLAIFGTLIVLTIKNKELGWLSISLFPYLLINFGYGLKNYIFIGFLIGIILFKNYNHIFLVKKEKNEITDN